jgi:hypothetical protein
MRTAVGLFGQASTADAVVDALRENGVPSTGIRRTCRLGAERTAAPLGETGRALAYSAGEIG